MFWRIRQAEGENGPGPRYPRFGSLQGHLAGKINLCFEPATWRGGAGLGSGNGGYRQDRETERGHGPDGFERGVRSIPRSRRQSKREQILFSSPLYPDSGEPKCRTPASSSADPATRLSRYPATLKAGGPVSGSPGLAFFLDEARGSTLSLPAPRARKTSSASLGLTDFSPVGILVWWYKSVVQFGTRTVLVSPNRCDRIVS